MSEQNNNEFQSVISNISHDGRGIVSNNGKKVFIDGVLPGETVSWVPVKRHRRYDEAKVDKVIVASEDRVEAICPNFLVCGGCSYQHMSTQKQLEYKQQIVKELLDHVGDKVSPNEWLAPLRSTNTSGYRTKARLGVKYVVKKEKILIGFREKATSFIADMQECMVLHPELNKLLQPLAALIADLSIYNKVAQIEFAMGDYRTDVLGRNIAVILRNLEGFNNNDNELLLSFAKEYNINLLLQPQGPDSVYAIYGSDKLIYQFKSSDGNEVNYQFHPQDFTQVNLDLNNDMLNKALDLLNLQGDESVLDLFCGLGNFTLAIAKKLSKGGKVHGIEGSDLMVKRANINSKLNDLSNTSFECLDLYNDKDQSLKNSAVNNHYDSIVLDPPRSGAKEVIPYIADKKNKIKKILYISCNPSTFARDVGVLCNEYGFKLDKVGIMDMFPHTKHVETIGLLVK